MLLVGKWFFVTVGFVLFGAGFLLLLCCPAEGYFDDGCGDGRVAWAQPHV